MQSSVWAADAIATASIHILCIALRYNKPDKSENHESILFIKTHGSESRGQGGSTLRRPLDERT